jgi:heme a synthase
MYVRLVHLTLYLTLILIVVGAATRVFDAGMSCPDWPTCYGLWWPWPEARVVNAGHLTGYIVGTQHYTWWQVALEWGHRGLAALVGIPLLALIILWFKHPHKALVGLPLFTAVGLLLIQVKLGAITVWLGNIHWSVAVHLGNAMLFLAALAWLRRAAVVAGSVRAPLSAPAPVRILAYTMPFFVWATMLLGAMVSSSHSGGICGGLPLCDGVLMPTDFGQHLHMQHRIFALLTFVLSIVLVAVFKRKLPALKPTALHVHFMVLGQVALGILTLYSFSLYPPFYSLLSVAHLAWGTLTFGAACALPLSLHYGSKSRLHA